MTEDYGTVISFPFRFGLEQGVVDSDTAIVPGTGGATMTTTDYRVIWKDRVYIAVLTNIGERVMRPTYGTRVLDSVFQTAETAKALVAESIATAFSVNLKPLSLIKVNPSYNENSGELSVNIEYRLPEGIIDSLTVFTDTFNRYGELIRRGS
jgi:phage baseplate assembly protein W